MAIKATPNVLATVNEFLVLPLRMPQQQSFPQEATHYLYLRANDPKVPTDDTPREIFLVNVPIDATEEHIRSLFAEKLGRARIESVSFERARVGNGIHAPVAPRQQNKKRKRDFEEAENDRSEVAVGTLPETWDRQLHRSGGTAIATFVDKASADLALRETRRAIKSKKEIIWATGLHGKVPSLGSARYQAHHKLRFPNSATLQASVDEYMAAFTAKEEAKAKELARQRSEPDEDGFITVTRGGRSGPAREEDTKAKEEELRKRQNNMVKEDFYRFQVREKKKEHAQDLVRAFEEDRRKVEAMKSRRGKIRPE